ncbi:hypothetical protein [Nonomuraea sp. NPDC049400]
MFDAFEQILRAISLRRETGELTVMTMEQAADHILAGADVSGAHR